MRYFLDTEFNERPGLLELISIGIVAEDGREFYAVADFDETNCNEWVRANVLPQLGNEVRWTRGALRKDILAFIGKDTPEFWGYFSDYDWVVFCWIFGAMVDLPTGWPMYCRDLKQEMDRLDVAMSGPTTGEHNALVDARWLRGAFWLCFPQGRK